jgi:Permease for cytosine/purines, uracil, thiamine, allantoin
MVVSAFAIGALGVTVFELGFVDGLLTILFINILGVIPVCFFSTFGPLFGMRQMILSRFFFGYYGVKLSRISPPPGFGDLADQVISRDLQLPRMSRLVICQCNRRSSTHPRRQH